MYQTRNSVRRKQQKKETSDDASSRNRVTETEGAVVSTLINLFNFVSPEDDEDDPGAREEEEEDLEESKPTRRKSTAESGGRQTKRATTKRGEKVTKATNAAAQQSSRGSKRRTKSTSTPTPLSESEVGKTQTSLQASRKRKKSKVATTEDETEQGITHVKSVQEAKQTLDSTVVENLTASGVLTKPQTLSTIVNNLDAAFLTSLTAIRKSADYTTDERIITVPPPPPHEDVATTSTTLRTAQQTPKVGGSSASKLPQPVAITQPITTVPFQPAVPSITISTPPHLRKGNKSMLHVSIAHYIRRSTQQRQTRGVFYPAPASAPSMQSYPTLPQQAYLTPQVAHPIHQQHPGFDSSSSGVQSMPQMVMTPHYYAQMQHGFATNAAATPQQSMPMQHAQQRSLPQIGYQHFAPHHVKQQQQPPLQQQMHPPHPQQQQPSHLPTMGGVVDSSLLEARIFREKAVRNKAQLANVQQQPPHQQQSYVAQQATTHHPQYMYSNYPTSGAPQSAPPAMAPPHHHHQHSQPQQHSVQYAYQQSGSSYGQQPYAQHQQQHYHPTNTAALSALHRSGPLASLSKANPAARMAAATTTPTAQQQGSALQIANGISPRMIGAQTTQTPSHTQSPHSVVASHASPLRSQHGIGSTSENAIVLADTRQPNVNASPKLLHQQPPPQQTIVNYKTWETSPVMQAQKSPSVTMSPSSHSLQVTYSQQQQHQQHQQQKGRMPVAAANVRSSGSGMLPSPTSTVNFSPSSASASPSRIMNTQLPSISEFDSRFASNQKGQSLPVPAAGTTSSPRPSVLATLTASSYGTTPSSANNGSSGNTSSREAIQIDE